MVDDVHAVVLHSALPDTTAAEGVNENVPKLRPEIVTENSVLAAKLAVSVGEAWLNTGASKLKRLTRVPTTALTVTVPYDVVWELGTPRSQYNVVVDVHAVVLQDSDAATTAAVGVKERAPKLRPEMVMAVRLLTTAFADSSGTAWLIRGAVQH